MHSSASPCIAQQNLHECSSPQSKLAESLLFHPFPVSQPRCPGVGAQCQRPVVQGTQEFRLEGLGRLLVVLQVLILDVELQAHSSATGGGLRFD